MTKRDDIPKTDPSEIEALIQRLKQSNIKPRDAQLVERLLRLVLQWPHFCNIRRNVLPIAQHKALRRVHAEWAEFIDVSWLLVHRRFEAPSIKGSATLARKYPAYRRHAAPAASHLRSNQSKAQSPLLAANL